VTALHQQLLDLLAARPTEDVFAPETAAQLLDSAAARGALRTLEQLSPSQVALAVLRALAAQRDALEGHALALELVATMPGFRSSVAQETGPAVLKLVRGAQRQLIVVGYELTNREFEHELHMASDRGVEVVIITDRGSRHGPRILSQWPTHLSLPRVYQERASDVSHMAKMHGKALLADGIRLFVSSANFTWLAVNANIELGVVLSGLPVRSARDLFEELLIESRLLERVLLGTAGSPAL
jgi:cardiolipin synthase